MSMEVSEQVLCCDVLTKTILGPRGSFKDQIQEESGARLEFTKKDDYFPNSYLRVLNIHADENWSILHVLGDILIKLTKCADQEHRRPAMQGCELVGKEQGEYVFRLCIPTKSISVLIGTGGQNIKQLQAETGVKVFFENEKHNGQQLARVVGQPDSLSAALEQINEYVQRDAGSEAFYSYSQALSFYEELRPEDTQQRWEPAGPPPAATPEVGRKPGHTYVRGSAPSPVVIPPRRHIQDAGGSAYQGAAHSPVVVAPRLRDTSRDGADQRDEPAAGPDVELLAEAVNSMPEGTAEMDYSIIFSLPDALQRRGHEEFEDFQQHLEETTGVRLEDAESSSSQADAAPSSRQVSLVGPLVCIYAAHLLLMKQAVDIEQAEAERSRQASSGTSGSVEEMQAQVQELQRQIEAKQALASSNQGKAGKASGGKGKGKGKSKRKHK